MTHAPRAGEKNVCSIAFAYKQIEQPSYKRKMGNRPQLRSIAGNDFERLKSRNLLQCIKILMPQKVNCYTS
jgi:hypothetical protein